MATVSSYDLVGVKEDVSDIISNIAPTKTPFLTLIGSENIHQKLHEWQEDTLDAPAANAQVEGASAPAAAYTPTVMRQNNTQILMKTASTTGTTDATQSYGRARELSYQLGKKGAEIKRDLEYALIGSGQSAVNTNSATARQMASAQVMIDTSVTVLTNGTVGSPGAAADLSEANILSANEALYQAGETDPTTILVKPLDAIKIANFANSGNRRRDMAEETKIVNVVDVYMSPYGEQKVVLDRWIRSTDSLVFNPGMWKKLVLRNWFRETLAKTGDSTSVMLVGEFSLKHRNFKGSALITNLD